MLSLPPAIGGQVVPGAWEADAVVRRLASVLFASPGTAGVEAELGMEVFGAFHYRFFREVRCKYSARRVVSSKFHNFSRLNMRSMDDLGITSVESQEDSDYLNKQVPICLNFRKLS